MLSCRLCGTGCSHHPQVGDLDPSDGVISVVAGQAVPTKAGHPTPRTPRGCGGGRGAVWLHPWVLG